MQWLRDGLGIIDKAFESEAYATSVSDTGGLYFVPAFVGLGAPHWDPYARGAILGITRNTGKAHLIRAALEAMAYQTADVLNLMERELSSKIDNIRVDGGAAANNFLLSFQADLLGIPIIRPESVESTARGAANLAGLYAGIYSSLDDIRSKYRTDKVFEPTINENERKKLIAGWNKAVERSKNWAD